MRLLRRATLMLPVLAAAARADSAAAWRMATEYPATSMPGEGIARFAEGVTRRAGGQLQVTGLFDAPNGLRSAGMLDAVRAARLQAGDAFAGALGSLDPLFLLPSLPFLTASHAEARRLYDLARPHYEAVMARNGAVLLYATPWPPSGLWTRRPVTTPEELAGLRLRTYDATGTEVLRAAGAAAVNLSFADAMTRLDEGGLDAVLSSGDGGAGRQLWRWLPHFTVADYAWPLSLAFCSAAELAVLPPPARQAVQEAARETEARQWAAIADRLAENMQRMRASGVTIHAPEPALRARLRAAGAAAVEAWAARAGERGRAVLAAYRA